MAKSRMGNRVLWSTALLVVLLAASNPAMVASQDPAQQAAAAAAAQVRRGSPSLLPPTFIAVAAYSLRPFLPSHVTPVLLPAGAIELNRRHSAAFAGCRGETQCRATSRGYRGPRRRRPGRRAGRCAGCTGDMRYVYMPSCTCRCVA
jgi:hypothetical protein